MVRVAVNPDRPLLAVALAAVLGASFSCFGRLLTGRLFFTVWRAVSSEAHGGQYANINGVRIWYEIYGNGPPVLVLHGGTGSLEDMHAQIRALAATRLVIAVDSRGHGRSTDADVPLSYALMADDMLKLLDHLNIRRTDIVGWSDGGIIGLDLAMHHPERVGRLVAIGANYDVDGLKEPPDQDGPVPPVPRAYARNAPDPAHWPTLYRKVATLWATQPHYTIGDLGKIKAQVLVIAGEFDVIRRAHTDQLAQAIPNAEEVIIEGGTHDVVSRQPDCRERANSGFPGRRNTRAAGDWPPGLPPGPYRALPLDPAKGSGPWNHSFWLRNGRGPTQTLMRHSWPSPTPQPMDKIAKVLDLCWRSRRQSLLVGSRAKPLRLVSHLAPRIAAWRTSGISEPAGAFAHLPAAALTEHAVDWTEHATKLPLSGECQQRIRQRATTAGAAVSLVLLSGALGHAAAEPPRHIDDGSAAALPGRPLLPGILVHYATRPPWKVAGVDYAVGVPAGTPLQDPATIAIAGTSVDAAKHTVVISGSNVTLKGYDFSRSGGWGIYIDAKAANTVDSRL